MNVFQEQFPMALTRQTAEAHITNILLGTGTQTGQRVFNIRSLGLYCAFILVLITFCF